MGQGYKPSAVTGVLVRGALVEVSLGAQNVCEIPVGGGTGLAAGVNKEGVWIVVGGTEGLEGVGEEGVGSMGLDGAAVGGGGVG